MPPPRRLLQGWDLQRAQLLAAAAVKPLAERTPALMYRGRADTGADAKRAAIVACREQLPPERCRCLATALAATPVSRRCPQTRDWRLEVCLGSTPRRVWGATWQCRSQLLRERFWGAAPRLLFFLQI